MTKAIEQTPAALTAAPPVLKGGADVAGVLRRRIILDARRPGHVWAGVEDDFHHFEVDLTHGDGRVTAVAGHTLRYPWSSCPGAGDKVSAFVGAAIGPAILRRRDLPDPLIQCTHLYELALLAVAQAGRGGVRTYDLAVPDRTGRTRFPQFTGTGQLERPKATDGDTVAEVRRDGEVLMVWEISGDEIVAPAGFAGHTIWTVMRYAGTHLDEDGIEAARVLRRVLHVSGGRVLPIDRLVNAKDAGPAIGACYSFQKERVEQALRVIGSTLDFTDHPERLLADRLPG